MINFKVLRILSLIFLCPALAFSGTIQKCRIGNDWRKILLFFSVVVCVFIIEGNCQDTIWTRTYGGIGNDYGYSVIQTNDGGFLICGNTDSFGLSTAYLYLIKTDSLGDTLWTKIHGPGIQSYEPVSAIQANDGTLAVVFNYGYWGRFAMANFGQSGSGNWEHDYIGGIGRSLRQTSDGDYILAGRISFASADDHFGVIKTDPLGDSLWTSTYGEQGADARSIQLTLDGGFIITGTTSWPGGTFLVKADQQGNEIWNHVYVGVGSYSMGGYSVIENNDNGFIITGEYYRADSADNIYVIKTNSLGDTLWTKAYGGFGHDRGESIIQTSDHCFIIAGYTISYGEGGDIYLIKIDTLGNIIWEQTYGGPEHDYSAYDQSVKQIDDGNLIVVGQTKSYGNQGDAYDIYLLKILYETVFVDSVNIGTSGDNQHILNSWPQIAWSFRSLNSKSQDSIEIEISNDDNWDIAEVWKPGAICISDTSILYSGETLVDGTTYYLRIRAHDSLFWSQWYNTTFRMNSVPTIPNPVSPFDDAVVPTDMPILTIESATDAEGDELAYDFYYVNDPAFGLPDTTLFHAGNNVSAQIPGPLNDNWRYFWGARAFDGFECSPLSDELSFWVNFIEQSPVAFSLVSPDESAGFVYNMLPDLTWTASDDPDPKDSVHYRASIAIDENFVFKYDIDSIWTTSHTLTDSLDFGTQYWWKVRAIDNTGLYANSNNILTFKTWKLGDATGDWQVNLLDILFLIDDLYGTGEPPTPAYTGDVNGDCAVNLIDILYLIAYLYNFPAGPAPVVGCE